MPGLFHQFFHRSDLQHLKTQSPYREEYRVRRKDGTLGYWTDKGAAVCNGQGHPYKMIGVCTDITERKQVEELLQRREEHFRSLIENVSDIIMVMSSDGVIRYASPSTERVIGHKPDQVIGITAVDFVHPDDVPALLDTLSRVVQSPHVAQSFEHRLRHKDGSWRMVETVGKNLHADAGATSVVVSSRDITERKRAEEALSKSETKYRSLVETTDTGIATIDSEGKLTLVNQALCEMVGHLEKELLGRHFVDFLHPQDIGRIMEVFQIAAQNPEAKPHLEFMVFHKDGHVVHCYSSPTVLWDQGQIIGFNAIIQDITERKQAEEAQQRLNRELALLNRASQTFNSTLDLDQVLTTILEEVRQQLDVTACSIWLMDPATGGLICQQATGPQHEIVRGWQLAPGQGIAGWVARSGESLNVPDVWTDERYFGGVDQETGLLLRSVLTVPLRVKQSVIGVLEAVDTGIARFSVADAALVESLAATAAVAIENARLYDQVRRDAATKSVLLQEINHRVKNNLTAIIGLLYAKQRYARAEDHSAWQTIVQDLSNHIQGLAVVHSLLSANEWAPLSLSEMTSQVIHAALQMLPSSQRVSVDVPPSTARVAAKQANSLALILNELTTNAAKYAASEDRTAHIGVRIVSDGGTLIEFRDDGPGFPDDVLRLERHNVGLYLVKLLVRDDLRGDVTLHNDGGAVITIRFKA